MIIKSKCELMKKDIVSNVLVMSQKVINILFMRINRESKISLANTNYKYITFNYVLLLRV